MKFRFVLLGPDDDPNDSPALPDSAAEVRTRPFSPVRYQRSGAGMVRTEQMENGRKKITALANFHARIIGDLILDDGDQQRREFRMEAEVAGQTLAFSVSAFEFARMSWVLNKLGPQAIIYPGQQHHARAAIQCLSGQIRQERIFAHLGWRKHGPHWVYLHGGGALGVDGPLPSVQVQLPAALQSYHLLPSKNAAERVRAVQASLRFLSLAPDRISLPLLAAVYRAPLGRVDLSLFLTGKTGVFKTALAAVCQQHFGAAMDASRLPTNFASTAPALQWLAFHAKDALLVVDDFAPSGRNSDGQLQSVSERLFRAAGNQQGRSRMGGDGRLSAPMPPRGLVLATGEEVPQGQSIRARQLIVEVEPGVVHRARLGESQGAAREGQFSAAMGTYVMWMAGHYEELQERQQSRVRDLRAQGYGRTVHARLPSALAELQAGWEIFLQFALEVGAIDRAEEKELEQRGGRALEELGVQQAKYQEASDPALRFVALLRGALMSGRAHVVDRQGRAPGEPAQYGWQCKGRRWVPQGPRIGWVAGIDLYLEPAASYQVAQQLAGGERLAVSEQTLRCRLREHGLLVSTDVGRQMLTVRRTLEGCPRQVLHLRVGDLVGAGEVVLSGLSGHGGGSSCS
jgi:hypothetical protein